MENILSKLKSVELCLSAHPDNEEHSEFADRISDLEAMQTHLKEVIDCQKKIVSALKELKFQVKQYASGDIGTEDYFRDEMKEAENAIYHFERVAQHSI